MLLAVLRFFLLAAFQFPGIKFQLTVAIAGWFAAFEQFEHDVEWIEFGVADRTMYSPRGGEGDDILVIAVGDRHGSVLLPPVGKESDDLGHSAPPSC